MSITYSNLTKGCREGRRKSRGGSSQRHQALRLWSTFGWRVSMPQVRNNKVRHGLR